MKYYLTTPDGEKGPYQEERIREWLRDGTMLRDAPVRREDEAVSRAASSMFPNEAPEPPSTTAPSDDFDNVYAPPKVTRESSDPIDTKFLDPGSYGTGFVFGLFCGCIAYLGSMWSDSMGSETKRGVKVGFAVHFFLGVLFRIMREAARAFANAYL